jgi:hypothetical protein
MPEALLQEFSVTLNLPRQFRPKRVSAVIPAECFPAGGVD